MEYNAFVARVKEYEKEGFDRKDAIGKAVKYCRENDILFKFLETNASEVLNMLITEWNWDDALAVRFEDGREEGREEGRQEGREEIAKKALVKGIPVEMIHDITGLDLETIKSL